MSLPAYQSRWMTGDVMELAELARRFFEKEVVPFQQEWAAQRRVDRRVWTAAGEIGLLCAAVPEQYGGGGATAAHDLAVLYEQARIGEHGFGNIVHSGVVARYLVEYGTEDQKRRWLPAMAAGRSVAAIALTEPQGGSNLAALRTRAVREGSVYTLNGSKAFVTNGGCADLVLVAAKTRPESGARGISLFVVEPAVCPGFSRGGPVDKVGQESADVAELRFDDVVVDEENRIGPENAGLAMMMDQLPWERLLIAVTAVAVTQRAVEITTAYAKQRPMFDATLFDLQNTRMELAECATLAHIGRVFVDECVELYRHGRLDAVRASMAKYWSTDTQCSVVDRCLQLFGAYGYTREYPIGRMYMDARAQRIYGGANEVMKEIIAGTL